MAPALRPQPQKESQKATRTLRTASPDQLLNVQEFLRSLKKRRRPNPTPKSLGAHPEPAEGSSHQLDASTYHKDFPYVGVMSGRTISGPPKSVLDKMHCQQVLGPFQEAKITRPSKPQGAEQRIKSMKIPMVLKTYSKKAKHASPLHADTSTLFSTQSFTREPIMPNEHFCDGIYTPTEQPALRESPSDMCTNKLNLGGSTNRKRQPLADVEQIRQVNRADEPLKDDEDDEIDLIEGDTRKTRRKRRRAPVNELPLVKTLEDLPSRTASPMEADVRTSLGQHSFQVSFRLCAESKANITEQETYDAGNAIDQVERCLNNQGILAPTLPRDERMQRLVRANTKKPTTKPIQALLSQRKVPAREGFRFPPTTPKASKAPGWRLGSGFEGMTIDQPTNRVRHSLRGSKIRHARTPRLLRRSLSKLPARSSSTEEVFGPRGLPEVQKQQGSPSETRNYKPTTELGSSDCSVESGQPQKVANAGKKATYEQAANLDTSINPFEKNDCFRTASVSYVDTITKEVFQQHLSQSRAFNASQALRGPSRSERNGWLKRRRANFAVAGEDEEDPLVVHTDRESVNNVKDNGRYGLDKYHEDNEQNQRTFHRDLRGFVGDGQTASDLEPPLPTQQQDVFQTRYRAERHKRRDLDDAKKQVPELEEDITRRQSSNRPPEPLSFSNFETDFSTSPLRVRGMPTPKVGQHMQVQRTSEVLETQERLKEPAGQDRTRAKSRSMDTCRIQETTLASARYFSKAVQQLDSLEKGPPIVTRRTSPRKLHQVDVRGCHATFETQKETEHVDLTPITRGQEAQEGSPILGVTPRLARRMSCVPFRPPFKELL